MFAKFRRLKKRPDLAFFLYLILALVVFLEGYYIFQLGRDIRLFDLGYANTLKYQGIDFITPSPTPVGFSSPVVPTRAPGSAPQPTDPIGEQIQNSDFDPKILPRRPDREFNFVYYYQCDPAIANLKLPDGCNFCQASCGPTTVAMILASFIDESWNPLNVADLYRQMKRSGDQYGYLGCSGSYMEAARKILSQYFRTTGYIFANNAGYRVEEVRDDLREFLENGYYIFALTRFKAGGHFIWIVDVDDQGNVWAYDSYYGGGRLVPLNENLYYPYPLYRVAFAFKKP